MALCPEAPVPDKAIVIVGLLALSVIVMLPVTGPTAAGEKETVITTDAPGARFSPFDIPLMVKPAPAMVTFEMVMVELLVSVNVINWLLAVPTFTFPKPKAKVLGFRPETTLGDAEGEAAREAEGETPTVPLHPD